MSVRDQQEKIFKDGDGNEVTYRCTPFGASKGLKLLKPLLKLISGPLGGLVGALGGEGESIQGSAMIEGLEALGEALEDVQKSKYIHSLLEDAVRICPETGEVQRPHEHHVFETVYQANYYELLQVLMWICEVNFAPFLRKSVGPLLAKLKAKMKSNPQVAKALNDLSKTAA